MSDSFVTPWTVTRQAPLSTGFARQECWIGLPFPSPGDLLDPGIESVSPELAGGFFTTEPPGKPRPSIHVSFSEALQVVLPADQVGDYGEFSSVAQLCPTLRPHGLQPTRLLHPWDFPGKSTGVGCHCLLRNKSHKTN